jgi:hypothetical protein
LHDHDLNEISGRLRSDRRRVWSDRNFSGFVDFIEALKRKKTCSIILPQPSRDEEIITSQCQLRARKTERVEICSRNHSTGKKLEISQRVQDDLMWSEGADDDISRDYHVFKPNINLHSTNFRKGNSPFMWTLQSGWIYGSGPGLGVGEDSSRAEAHAHRLK